jgi:hypothetical protein
VGGPDGAGAVDLVHEAGEKGVLDEGGLAGAGDTRDAGEEADRERGVDGAEVVSASASQNQPAFRHVDRSIADGGAISEGSTSRYLAT